LSKNNYDKILVRRIYAPEDTRSCWNWCNFRKSRRCHCVLQLRETGDKNRSSSSNTTRRNLPSRNYSPSRH